MPSHIQNSITPSQTEADPKRRAVGTDECEPVSPMVAWLGFCVFLNCIGWILSALHVLNRVGYCIAFAIGLAVVVWCRKKSGTACWLSRNGRRLKRRFSRPSPRAFFPRAFLILASLAFLGGALYMPSNYDGLTYRLPRALHWLAEQRWHWIHTMFPRVNTRATGIEWVSAPILSLFRTDRPLFLINIVSFLLLPGVVFSMFTRLGVRPRVAWHWMWIVPTGYSFLLQAGSIGNDLFGAVFAAAAVDFALRAQKSQSRRDVFCSILAAAMMTNSKLSNLPLLLPWAVCLLPSVPLLFRWPVRTVVVCVIAALVSLAPISILNWRNCGDWTGLKGEGISKKDQLVQFGANVVLITTGNLVPPVFPFVDQWNRMMERAIPPGLTTRLEQTMEGRVGSKLAVQGEMQIEESAGLGFGVSALLLVSVAALLFRRRNAGASPVTGTRGESIWRKCERWSPAISLVVLMTQSNLAGPGRILTTYYALLIPILLAPAAHEQLVKRRWWRASVWLVFLMAAGLLVISPARPLFPAQTILAAMRARLGDSRLLTRAQAVYTVYRDRGDAFAPARAALPPDLKVLGFVTYDDPETSLWRPFGSRRIEHVRSDDSAADLKRRGIEYILVKPDVFGTLFPGTPEEWFTRMNAQQPVQKISLHLRVTSGPLDWYLVRLQ